MTEQRSVEPTNPDRERRLGPAARDSSSWRGCKALLHQAGLRPTRQRMMLAWILFSRGNRHLTAEMLYDEALGARVPVSLATVYNTLHQFTQAGLLRQIGVDGSKSFFDTNPTVHHHFFVEAEEILFDVPETSLALDRLPQAPEGYEIVRVDMVVRLRRQPPQQS